MNKEQVAHDLALIVVENLLEDIDELYEVRQYAREATQVYLKARDIIIKELDKES